MHLTFYYIKRLKRTITENDALTRPVSSQEDFSPGQLWLKARGESSPYDGWMIPLVYPALRSDIADKTYEPFLTPIIGGQYSLNLWFIHKVEKTNLMLTHKELFHIDCWKDITPVPY